MAKIGMIAMSAKPAHAGHIKLIELASKENDLVNVYVSLTTRKRKGELVVYGEDMEEVWNKHLLKILPDNVNVEFVSSPVGSVFEALEEAESDPYNDSTFSVYSDPTDMEKNSFNRKTFMKYVPRMTEEDRVNIRPVLRTDTVDVSGTKMRHAVETDDFETFASGMPAGVDAEAVWDILRKRMTHKSDYITEDYIRDMIYNRH